MNGMRLPVSQTKFWESHFRSHSFCRASTFIIISNKHNQFLFKQERTWMKALCYINVITHHINLIVWIQLMKSKHSFVLVRTHTTKLVKNVNIKFFPLWMTSSTWIYHFFISCIICCACALGYYFILFDHCACKYNVYYHYMKSLI